MEQSSQQEKKKKKNWREKINVEQAFANDSISSYATYTHIYIYEYIVTTWTTPCNKNKRGEMR